MALIEVTPPAVEPVSKEDCYGQLNLPAEGDPLAHPKDAELTRYIAVARRVVEQAVGFALIEQTLELRLDFFPPSPVFASLRRGYGEASPRQDIWLPRPRLRAVVSVDYIDMAGQGQSLDPGDWEVYGIGDDGGGRIRPAYGTSWPGTRCQPEAVKVRFTSGFGTAAAEVPEEFRQAILLYVEALFDVAVNEGPRGAMPAMPGAGWMALSHWRDRQPQGLEGGWS